MIQVVKFGIDCYVLYELIRLILYFNRKVKLSLSRHNAMLDKKAIRQEKQVSILFFRENLL